MAPIVYFSFPAHGHVNPTLPVMRELVCRGEQVVYFGAARFQAAIAGTGATFCPYTPEVAMPEHGPGPFARVASTLEALLAFSRAILDRHLEQVRALEPQSIAFDSFAPWGGVFARLLRLPSIASVPSILINRDIDARYGRGQPGDPQLTPEWYAGFRARCRALPTAPEPEQLLQTYGDLNIVYTSRIFQPMSEAFDGRRFQFVGPCFDALPAAADGCGGRPLVLISMGTVYGDSGFLARCAAELEGAPWRIELLDGRQTQAAQIELLQRCSVFVTHSGMNSVQEALYFGVPMVLAPQAADQFWIAARTVELGAGILLDAGIREPIERMLANPQYRIAAGRVGASLRETGGAVRAADLIQSFLRARASLPFRARVGETGQGILDNPA